ncbi:MAG: helix-turn-helix transcriptional regulator [Bacteroidota bacterium]
MKGTYLGEFEELVLLTVAMLKGKAYGVLLTEELEKQAERKFSLSSVHTALYRLEKKGFVRAEMSEATHRRGGRRKKLYQITAAGKAALVSSRDLRNRLWDLIPDFKFWALN